jgi:hypothetical protein
MSLNLTSPSFDPYKSDVLFSYPQFSDYLKESHRRGSRQSRSELNLEDIQRKYDAYKENFTKKQYEKFFQKNKDSEW